MSLHAMTNDVTRAALERRALWTRNFGLLYTMLYGVAVGVATCFPGPESPTTTGMAIMIAMPLVSTLIALVFHRFYRQVVTSRENRFVRGFLRLHTLPDFMPYLPLDRIWTKF